MSDDRLRELAIDAVWQAGVGILQKIESGERLKAWKKKDNTLVLNVDLDSERELLSILKTTLPCVSEEDEESHAVLETADSFFLLDPLDGTTSCKRFLSARDSQVGFGPLVGVVQQGKLVHAAFFHIPRRTLYVASSGKGVAFLKIDHGERSELRALPPPTFPPLNESAALFYPGAHGELLMIERLRQLNKIENAYRFGGFANDCIRLANGDEQIQIQLSVRAWDFSALLFPVEQGLAVTLDPLGKGVPFADWRVAESNPTLVCPPGHTRELLEDFRIAVKA